MALKRVALLIFAFSAFGAAAPVHAEDWAVSRIQYVNEGGYVASFTVDSRNFEGNSVSCGERSNKSNALSVGQSVTIVVSEDDGAPSKKCEVNPGFEVWGVAWISEGISENGWKRKNCRKDNARFFAHPMGGTLVLTTRGSTQNNNRCRIRSKGGVRWSESLHGQNIYQD